MIPMSPPKVRQPDDNRQGFLKLARQLSETIGTEFFSMLAHQLAGVLEAKCVYVGEFVEDKSNRVRTLAAFVEDDRPAAFDFPLAGSPDAEVASGSPCVYPTAVREMFPGDPVLHDLEAVAWVGVPLNNSEGQARGLIAAIYGQPLQLEVQFIQSMLKIFVPRASAELNRKQAEDLLRKSEQRYRTFVEMNPDACWRLEFDEPIDTALPEEEQVASAFQHHRFAECNPAAQLLGLKTGGAVTAVLDPETARSIMLSLIRSGYRYSTVEVTPPMGRKGKRRHFLHIQWGIVENGKLQRIWGSCRDITDLRGIEAEFRHAQKLDSIGRLAAGVAHDFNNLLAVIRGYSSQLLEHTETTDNAFVGLTEIQKAAEQGAALTNQLLTLSRKQSAELQVLDLNPIVEEEEKILRRAIGKNIELETELAPSVALVRANASCMHQVLLNLAVNARDAMPNGGKLTIRLSNVDIGETRPSQLTAVEPGPYVRLSVADNGMGMSPDVKARLFEPFFTTKGARGTGLGLSTVYRIVRQSRGQIIVETEPNKGTTFEIFLPREST